MIGGRRKYNIDGPLLRQKNEKEWIRFIVCYYSNEKRKKRG